MTQFEFEKELRNPASSTLTDSQKTRAGLLLPRWVSTNTSLRGDFTPPTPVPNPQTGILFETNWSDDTGYVGTNLATGTSEGLAPTGWDRARTTGASSFTVVSGGEDGSNVMRVVFDHVFNGGVNLYKHLTQDISTGYSELYIQYKFRFPNDCIFGQSDIATVSKLDYWKWLRLWQNTSWPFETTSSGVPGSWTENRSDSGYCVANFIGDQTFGIQNTSVWNANVLAPLATNIGDGSSGSPQIRTNPWQSGVTLSPYTDDPGFWQSIGSGALDIDWSTGRFLTYPEGSQGWHKVQFQFKCATAGQQDGVFAAWYDGVEQDGISRRFVSAYGAPAATGIPTPADPGFNCFVFLDNWGRWFKRWDPSDETVSGYVEFDHVIVSTDFIEDTYEVNG